MTQSRHSLNGARRIPIWNGDSAWAGLVDGLDDVSHGGQWTLKPQKAIIITLTYRARMEADEDDDEKRKEEMPQAGGSKNSQHSHRMKQSSLLPAATQLLFIAL